jgi:hypothetical protein
MMPEPVGWKVSAAFLIRWQRQLSSAILVTSRAKQL